jgi:hypothetical protein
MTGKKVMQQNYGFNAAHKTAAILVSGLQKGSYILVIRGRQGIRKTVFFKL